MEEQLVKDTFAESARFFALPTGRCCDTVSSCWSIFSVFHGESHSALKFCLHAQKDIRLTEQKLVLLAKRGRGYTPLQEETLDPEHQSVGDTKEGFYICHEPYVEGPG